MIASIAQGLHLSLDERDHLFRLAGHHPPTRGAASEHVEPRPAAHLRPARRHPGRDRHRARRDAAPDPARRRADRRPRPATPGRPAASATGGSPTRPRGALYPPEDHDVPTRGCTPPGCAAWSTLRGPGSRAAHLAELLLARSEEFRTLWDAHEVGIRPHEVKRFVHPEVGAARAELPDRCSTPTSRTSCSSTPPTPGSASHEGLRLLGGGGRARPRLSVGSRTRCSAEHPQVAHALDGLADRVAGRARREAQLGLRAVVADHQRRRLVAGHLLGRHPCSQVAERARAARRRSRATRGWARRRAAGSAGPPLPGVSIAATWAAATSRTSAMPKRCRGASGIWPPSIAVKTPERRPRVGGQGRPGDPGRVQRHQLEAAALALDEVPGRALGDRLRQRVRREARGVGRGPVVLVVVAHLLRRVADRGERRRQHDAAGAGVAGRPQHPQRAVARGRDAPRPTSSVWIMGEATW